jgi:hypothetical protein
MNNLAKLPNAQSYFVDLLKKSVPHHVKLAEEMSQLLEISADSAYRRIRCETDITLNEALSLCRHFDISLDSLSPSNPNSVMFRVNNLTVEMDSFTGYLDQLCEDLEWITRFDNGEVIYAAEDIPVFYNFYFPQLAIFKMFYWTKSIQNVTELQGKKIEELVLPESWGPKVNRIGELFLKLNSIDLWSEDTIKSVINQVKFYWEAGFFGERETALAVVDQLANLVEMVQKQSETGKKMQFSKGQYTNSNYTLYVSDLMIGNNCVFLKAQDKMASYIGFHSFNYMRTTDVFFNTQSEIWARNLIAKSTLISSVAEKARNQFFKLNFAQVDALRKEILEE